MTQVAGTLDGMKIFISSPISGYESFRDAAAEAVETLGHQVVRAEDFPASARTPQQACLGALRASDLVVVLLGAHYGAEQPSGLSATHEEFRERRETKPVLVLSESHVERDPRQSDFRGATALPWRCRQSGLPSPIFITPLRSRSPRAIAWPPARRFVVHIEASCVGCLRRGGTST